MNRRLLTSAAIVHATACLTAYVAIGAGSSFDDRTAHSAEGLASDSAAELGEFVSEITSLRRSTGQIVPSLDLRLPPMAAGVGARAR